jgi:hypothetical protein
MNHRSPPHPVRRGEKVERADRRGRLRIRKTFRKSKRRTLGQRLDATMTEAVRSETLDGRKKSTAFSAGNRLLSQGPLSMEREA